MVPRHELMNIVSVTQLEKDTILVCHDNMVKVHTVNVLFFRNCNTALQVVLVSLQNEHPCKNDLETATQHYRW